MNREQLRQLAVAGTITIPATFPRLAEIWLKRDLALPLACGDQQLTYLVAIERPSVRVTIKRIIPVADVRAVFLPRNPKCVNLNDGSWLLGTEVEMGLNLHAVNHGRVLGIVYVAEQTPTILEVCAGMTAAESSQYYPPLPVDRSINHYDPYRRQRSAASQAPLAWPSQESDQTVNRDWLMCEPDYASRPPSSDPISCDDGDCLPSDPCEPDPYPCEDGWQ